MVNNFYTHPLFIGVSLIVLSFVCGRVIFLLKGEIIIWLLLMTFGLFMSGILTLKGWWKNNIFDMNTKHNVNFKHR